MHMQSHAGVANHVDLICQPTCTGLTRPNQIMAKVDLNMQVPTQNDNSEHHAQPGNMAFIRADAVDRRERRVVYIRARAMLKRDQVLEHNDSPLCPYTSLDPPNVLISDEGSALKSAAMESHCKLYGIYHNVVSPGNHKANGLAERYVGTLHDAMTHLPDNKLANWHTLCEPVVHCLKCSREGP
jgi:hypothetical protein